MVLFFAEFIDQHTALLEEDEFTHCIKVLRNQIGDRIQATNGKGWFAEAEIAEISNRRAKLHILDSKTIDPLPYKINIGIAAPKSKNRWDLLLEKTVETGIDSITPVQTDNTERTKINTERAHKVMRSAALQSKRVMHPVLNDAIRLADIVAQNKDRKVNKLIAHFNTKNKWLSDLELIYNESLILIGPEGDFSDAEIELCVANGFVPVNISTNRLRTETAAIVATSQLATRHHSLQTMR